jgi:hypothetical protein
MTTQALTGERADLLQSPAGAAASYGTPPRPDRRAGGAAVHGQRAMPGGLIKHVT